MQAVHGTVAAVHTLDVLLLQEMLTEDDSEHTNAKADHKKRNSGKL